MRKLLLISSFLLIALQTFSYSPKNAAITTTTSTVPIEMNGMTVQEFLLLTPKKYQEITGRRMTFKQKISFSILKAKLKRQLAGDKSVPRKTDLGTISLLSGIVAIILFLVQAFTLGFFIGLVALAFGIFGLKKNKKDSGALIGTIIGGAFFIFLLFGLFFLYQLK